MKTLKNILMNIRRRSDYTKVFLSGNTKAADSKALFLRAELAINMEVVTNIINPYKTNMGFFKRLYHTLTADAVFFVGDYRGRTSDFERFVCKLINKPTCDL